MSADPNLTDRDTEQLSAYIDGALDESERAELEARLQADAALRRELDALRHTVALVRDLPPLKAPRDFTLTPAMLEGARVTAPVAPRRIIRFPALSLVSAAASVVMIFLGALLLLGDTAIDTAAPARVSAPMDADSPAPLASPDVVAVAATKTAAVVEEELVEALDAPEVETFDEALEAAAEVASEPETMAVPDAPPGLGALDDSDGPTVFEMPAPLEDADGAPVDVPVPQAVPPVARQTQVYEAEALDDETSAAAGAASVENQAVEAEEEAVGEIAPDEDAIAARSAEAPPAEPTPQPPDEVITDPQDSASHDVLGWALVLAGLGLLAFVVYTVARRRSPPHDR
ncbi:MAG: hypothetical protein ACOCZH_04895 [Phototrophicaceae bacterium]